MPDQNPKPPNKKCQPHMHTKDCETYSLRKLSKPNQVMVKGEICGLLASVKSKKINLTVFTVNNSPFCKNT